MTPEVAEPAWVPIAIQRPPDRGRLHAEWQRLPGSAMTIDAARRLYDDGAIEMAQQRGEDGAFLLVILRRRRPAAGRRPWFRTGPTAGRAVGAAAGEVA